MFAVNDTVHYGMNGVCKIVDIRSCQFQENAEDYYILKPIHDVKSVIYVPVKNEALVSKMRRVLSQEEVHNIIRSMPEEQTQWIEDDHQRQEAFKAMIHSGDSRQLVQLIKTLYAHQKRQQARGRKLRAGDERLMQDAERILYDEFALVLDIRPNQVLSFIMEELDTAAK